MKMNEGTYIISRNSDMYPARLEGLSNMPEELYVMGSLPDEQAPAVAIVGARMCSRYGHNIAFTFGKKLAEHGVSVISGMAIGIDGAAQEGALSGGGKTYAVLGCGVDVCYPRSNRMLYDQIPAHGGILSEFSLGTQPLPYNFPLRNRLISALADVVIVVEARKKSGSLITVDYALEQGRSVYAVPGRVGDALSDGCNYLIAQGAGIAWSVEAIIEELSMQASLSNAARAARLASAAKLRQLSAEGKISGKCPEREKDESESIVTEAGSAGERPLPQGVDSRSVKGKILLALGSETYSQDELVKKTGLSVPDLNAAMGEMLLLGYIEEVGRARYVRTHES